MTDETRPVKDKKSAPLRRIVDIERVAVLGGYLDYEVLACGHRQRPVSDCIGETNAERRRCRACVREAGNS